MDPTVAPTAMSENITEAELPANLKKIWLKALSAVELRNYGYAVSLLAAILKEQPTFLDGRTMMRKAAVQKVKSEKKLIKFPSGGISAVKFQGQIKKDPQAAIVAIEKELEKDPYNVQLNQALHDAALGAGMIDTAAFALETVLEGHPENTKVGHQLADFYLKNEHPDRASKIYQAIVKQDPTDLEAVQAEKNASARASMKQQKWDSAGDFRDLMKNKDEAASLEQESRAAMTPEQIQGQLEELSAKYEEDPNNLAVVKRIAALYEQLEDWENSLTYYEWAYQLSNKDTTLERRIGQIKDKQRDLDLHVMQQELDAETDVTVIEEKKKKIEGLREGRAKQMIVDARERVERNPTDAQLRFELGSALYNAGEFSDAIPELQKAKNNAYLRIKTMLMLGLCYERKNMNDLAVRTLKEGNDELLTMDDTKKEILYNMGLIYEKMQDKANSLECMKQIYEADYGYRDVAARVEESYSGDEDTGGGDDQSGSGDDDQPSEAAG